MTPRHAPARYVLACRAEAPRDDVPCQVACGKRWGEVPTGWHYACGELTWRERVAAWPAELALRAKRARRAVTGR